MQTIVEIMMKQAFKPRGILDNDFLQLVIPHPIVLDTEAFKGKGVDR
jgi:hypothetical protein